MRIALEATFDAPCNYIPVPVTPEWEQAILSYDLVQCLDYYEFGANACRVGHPRVVCYLNENIPFNPQYTGRAGANKRVIQKQAARFVAVSRSVRDSLLTEGIVPERITICPFWVTLEVYRPLFPVGDEEARHTLRRMLSLPETLPLVLYVGRLCIEKGLKIAEQALFPHHEEWTWALIGEIQNYRPPAWATYIPPQPPEMLLRYYNAADVLVLPSLPTPTWIEQFGRVLVEAQACGCPVIATDLGGPRDIVRHGHTGFLVPPGNPDSLRGAIGRIVQEKALRDRLRQNARRGYLRAFETGKVSARLRQIYEEVMASP